MLKVIDVVRDIISSSEPELTALSRRVLNLSAYAKRIHGQVERRTQKPVQLGTIVVALSRIATELTTEDPLLPVIELDSIAVKSNLAEVCFNKTPANKMRAQKLFTEKEFAQADFPTITYGTSEVSIFAPMQLVKPVLARFKPEKPKLLLDHLAALTIQFGERYIETPNLYFGLFRALAVRSVNVVEVVSTFTELTFLIRQSDLNQVFQLMNSLMRQKL
jgi:aspartokinase